MATSPIILWQIDRGTVKIVADFIFFGLQNQMVIAAMKLNDAYSLEGKL